MPITTYRYPREHLVLAFTLFLVFVVIALTAVATVCGSVLFVLGFVILSYYFGLSHHQTLLRSAQQVTPQNMPAVARIVRQCENRLTPGSVQVFIAPAPIMNAYTFGLSSPKVVVMYAGLFKVMDEDEIAFILGHEFGHVALGHTWLNSLIGGMAGIPTSWGAGVILTMAFLWWNRVCELSADRAGMLACGKPEKAISALVKLAAGPEADTRAELEEAYRQIDAQDDTILGPLSEVVGTHPMLIRRIQELRRYARSDQYQHLQEKIDRRI